MVFLGFFQDIVDSDQFLMSCKAFKGGVVLPSDIEIGATDNKVLIKVNSVTTLN